MIPDPQQTNLVTGYLDVCNAVLEANRRSFPYKPIIALYDKVFSNRQVRFEIYGENPKDVETTATVRLVNGIFEPVPETQLDPKFTVKVKRDYMERVVADRRRYIEHPELLDWDWLKSRLGMTGEG